MVLVGRRGLLRRGRGGWGSRWGRVFRRRGLEEGWFVGFGNGVDWFLRAREDGF